MFLNLFPPPLPLLYYASINVHMFPATIRELIHGTRHDVNISKSSGDVGTNQTVDRAHEFSPMRPVSLVIKAYGNTL